MVNNLYKEEFLSLDLRSPNRVEYLGINLDRLQEVIINKKIKGAITKEVLVDKRYGLKKRFS